MDNQDDPFGLAASTIKSLAYVSDGIGVKASKMEEAIDSITDDDFNALII